MYRHEPQGLIWNCPCMVFFTRKDLVPIDWHYMTDRLQRFELKIFVCVLLKKQSHLHLGCPGGKQINIKKYFWVNYPFNIMFSSVRHVKSLRNHIYCNNYINFKYHSINRSINERVRVGVNK